VTLAPEAEGALGFIEQCVQQDIVVGLGHHHGTASDIMEAVDRGATVSTHLGNGCATRIHRHLNPLWPQLAEDRLMASMIADGFHLRPEELQVFFKVKGPDRLLLVSDMTELAGMPPGEYPWNGESIVLTPEGMITYPGQNVLAGASLPLTVGVRTIMTATGCSLSDAIQMASSTPAKLNGFDDRGELEVGKRGDCILFSCGESALDIHKTYVAGREVYAADAAG